MYTRWWNVLVFFLSFSVQDIVAMYDTILCSSVQNVQCMGEIPFFCLPSWRTFLSNQAAWYHATLFICAIANLNLTAVYEGGAVVIWNVQCKCTSRLKQEWWFKTVYSIYLIWLIRMHPWYRKENCHALLCL